MAYIIMAALERGSPRCRSVSSACPASRERFLLIALNELSKLGLDVTAPKVQG